VYLMKDSKQIQTILTNYLKVHNTTFQTELKNTNNIPDLKKIIIDNLKAIYATITSVSKMLGDDKFSFEKIFTGSNAELIKVMNKDPKIFENKVSGYVDSLILTQSKQFGYDEADVKKQLDQTSEEVAAEQTNQVKDVTTTENIINLSNNKLFEAEDEQPVQTEIQPVQTEPAQTESTSDDKFTKLKDANKKWFDIAIYKKINDIKQN